MILMKPNAVLEAGPTREEDMTVVASGQVVLDSVEQDALAAVLAAMEKNDE